MLHQFQHEGRKAREEKKERKRISCCRVNNATKFISGTVQKRRHSPFHSNLAIAWFRCLPEQEKLASQRCAKVTWRVTQPDAPPHDLPNITISPNSVLHSRVATPTLAQYSNIAQIGGFFSFFLLFQNVKSPFAKITYKVFHLFIAFTCTCYFPPSL